MIVRKLLIGLAYYDNPRMLDFYVAALGRLPAEMQDALRLSIVDDCSPRWPAVEVLLGRPELIRIGHRLHRMAEDVPWNQDACRNLIVAESDMGLDEWVLLTDMDHLPSPALLARVMTGELRQGAVYTFARVNAPDGEPYKPHPNSWLLQRRTYQAAGGYDERFRGVYGTDGRFAGQLERVAGPPIHLKEPLIRYPREVIADASTTSLTRKSPENDARRDEIKRAIKASGSERPVTGLTAWERLL